MKVSKMNMAAASTTHIWKVVDDEGTIVARFLREDDAKRFVAAMGMVKDIARMTATGDTESYGEPLDEPYEQGPDDAMETIDSLIIRARDITKGA